MASELDLTPKQIREYLDRARLPLSLDLRVGDNQDTELGDLLEDTGTTPEDFALQASLRTDLDQLMEELTQQQLLHGPLGLVTEVRTSAFDVC